jgi:hypothetical protein
VGFAAGRRGAALDVALAAGGLLYSGLLAALSFQYSFEARVFALVAAAAGLATSLVYLIASMREYSAATVGERPAEGLAGNHGDIRRRLVLVTALLAASIVVLYLFGAYIFSFTFALVFLKAFAHESWRTSLQVAAGLTLFNYLMFNTLFGLRFDAIGILLP